MITKLQNVGVPPKSESPTLRIARPVPTPTLPTKGGSDISKGSVAEKQISPERRQQMIAEAAYFRAQRRGFAPGAEAQDWLESEAEVEELLAAG